MINIKTLKSDAVNIELAVNNNSSSLSGIYGIISDITNTIINNNDLSQLNNLSIANNSTFIIKHNITNTYNSLNMYTLYNSKIFIDNYNIRFKTNNVYSNNFLNFPNLTVNINPIDIQYNINVNNLSNSYMVNTFYINCGVSYNTTLDTQLLSPRFLNNGITNYWGTNKNQRLLSDLEYIVDKNNAKIFNEEILPNIPRNLNGNALNIIIKLYDNNINKNYDIILSGFFGGQINITGRNAEQNIGSDVKEIYNDILKENSSILDLTNKYINYCNLYFENCQSIININNLYISDKHITSLNDQISLLSFKNCRSVNIKYLNYLNQIISNENAFYSDNSNIYITTSLFNFGGNFRGKNRLLF